MLGLCFDVAAADFDCCASALDAVPMMQAPKKTIVNKLGANLIPADGCGMYSVQFKIWVLSVS